ncbi:ATP-binding protein [Pseudonocardia alni]|uniref:ATP-binding protein n=1 Tax=Pseudonocardia alni TaxID=33907 RepID=UPI003D9E6FBD
MDVGTPPALTGRRSEVRRLQELIGATRATRGGALVLRGEAGIGRTALLDHAPWAAAQRLAIDVPPASTAAAATGLVEFGTRIRFCHPLARSAVYGGRGRRAAAGGPPGAGRGGRTGHGPGPEGVAPGPGLRRSRRRGSGLTVHVHPAGPGRRPAAATGDRSHRFPHMPKHLLQGRSRPGTVRSPMPESPSEHPSRADGIEDEWSTSYGTAGTRGRGPRQGRAGHRRDDQRARSRSR